MNLKDKLEAGRFVVLAEMEPPKGVDVDQYAANAIRVKDQVDAFIAPEMSNAVMRMSALGACLILQGKGLETVMQVNCRDRNRLALQGDLLAAAARGVQSIIAVTGEDPSFGDHHQASAVYDIDIYQLLEAVGGLNAGKDMAGVDLAGAPSFICGAMVNACARGRALDLELEDLGKKMKAGARYFVTPPIFDMASLDAFLAKAPLDKAALLPTVLLLKSVGMARYIDKHSDHINIGADLIQRIVKAEDKARECAAIAGEVISAAKDYGLGGVVVSTLGWEHKLPQILSMKHKGREEAPKDDPGSGWGKHARG